jgi:hypothetical protein
VAHITPPVPTISDLNQVLADTPFLQSYGFRVESTAPGECTLRVLSSARWSAREESSAE